MVTKSKPNMRQLIVGCGSWKPGKHDDTKKFFFPLIFSGNWGKWRHFSVILGWCWAKANMPEQTICVGLRLSQSNLPNGQVHGWAQLG